MQQKKKIGRKQNSYKIWKKTNQKKEVENQTNKNYHTDRIIYQHTIF